MKILKNEFKIEVDRFDDPGTYPCGAGGSPLPSYEYISEIEGELIVELEEGETADDPEELANEHARLPQGISVTEWAWTEQGNRFNFSVNQFDASQYEGPEKDYEDKDPFGYGSYYD